MKMEKTPLSFAPKKNDLPGEVLGQRKSGDAELLATAVERDGPYLAVSPRTPYNRYVIPMLSLSATVKREGKSVFDGTLKKASDPELGYHYRANVQGGVRSGGDVTITVDAPPQVSRHEGYETAFLKMPKVSI